MKILSVMKKIIISIILILLILPQQPSFALRPMASGKRADGITLEPDYWADMPEEVISIARQFDSIDDLEEWVGRIILDMHSGGQITPEALSSLETICLLFGFESKPDNGLMESRATFFKNMQVSGRDKDLIHEVFYSSEQYEPNDELVWEPDTMWETIEFQFYKILKHVIENDNKVQLFSRIKQYKSLFLKLERITAGMENANDYKPSLNVAEIIKKIMARRAIIAANPAEYFDDILGFNFVIDDTGMSEDERKDALTAYSDQVEEALRVYSGIKITKIRKESRIPGFEAVNLFIQGWLNHKVFGALGIKVQFRFKTALFQESAMYYTYKRYNRWELPPWAQTVDFKQIASFRQMQEILFTNFKKYFESRELARHFSVSDVLTMPSGWPSSFDFPSKTGSRSSYLGYPDDKDAAAIEAAA